MRPDTTQHPRQEPVSCETCRKKKLKCNREQPCSNCLTRSVACDFQGRKVRASTYSPPVTEEVPILRAENAAIKARIDRLEELVVSGKVHIDPDERPAKARRLGDHERSTHALPSPTTTLSTAAESESARNYRGEVQWLEGIGTLENTRLSKLSAPFTAVRVVPLEQIVQQALSEPQHDRCIYLPCEEQIMLVFDYYAEQLDPLQHLLHIPTVRESIKTLYHQLSIGKRVEPNRTILPLVICASMSSYWGLSDHTSSIFGNMQAATNVAVLWLRTALDVLEHVRRSSLATLETIQASIIVIFLIYHVEGFSPKVRAILYTTLAAAKDLGLHRTDDPSYIRQQETPMDVVDLEMRRRIWWHLASTDWSLALAGGPHEGTYSVNPKHMRVRRPRNISDEELVTMPADFEHPLSEPTMMAYYLQRIRLSEICRRIADMAWDLDLDQIVVDDIRELDSKFDRMLAELPAFLRLDEEDRERYHGLDESNTHIFLHRYIVNLTIQAKRCKFHLPFLPRASHDDSYAFSRKACLRAARTVIHLRCGLANEPGSIWVVNAKLCGMLHMYFYATMVLVMDFCVNRTAGCEEERKAEIQTACKTLEDAKEQSGCAGMFIDSLTAILHKHRIRLRHQEQDPEAEHNVQVSKAAETNALAPAGTSNSINRAMTSGLQLFNNFDFDEVWQSYIDAESTIDPQSWDALVSDIENLYQGNEHGPAHI